jgi:hypothetical protein
MNKCPTCGGEVEVKGTGTTHYYSPTIPQRDILAADTAMAESVAGYERLKAQVRDARVLLARAGQSMFLCHIGKTIVDDINGFLAKEP